MSQSQSEIAKEITIAAIQAGTLINATLQSAGGVEKANEFNAQQIAKLYKTIYESVLNPRD